MDDKKISVEELKDVVGSDYESLLQEVVDSINDSRDGHIIADSEELVREASSRFRKLLFEKALENLQKKQDTFSP